ncbi:hypothetical protein SASPL_112390 [Salvia splendens]|uniref:Uncharacterized protein n=1 Tax=Salvia splendens TaxID=180675 RepID=A0A8X9A582_SALSN|nr:uncharacterized protein LOC121799985 [Salvia splendens]KAG6428141.1 hypothetical protein SASPL_112390 [Salvia splendens]
MEIFTTKSVPNTSPIFPIPQHFTDYGFEPQLHYFQVLEEARKQKRERSIDLHLKLQKPISKDESSKKIKKTKKRWWRNALRFFKPPKGAPPAAANHDGRCCYRISSPIYITESRSGASTPYRRPGEAAGVPYFSLRELNAAEGHRISAAEMPIYLVT